MSSHTCPLCGCDQAKVGDVLAPDGQRTRYLQIFCPLCGHFDITEATIDDDLEYHEWKRQRVSHLLAERYKRNIYTSTNDDTRKNDAELKRILRNNRILIYNDAVNETPLSDYDGQQITLRSWLKSYPRTPMEKAERALVNFARDVSCGNLQIIYTKISPALMFSSDEVEKEIIRDLMEHAGWIEVKREGFMGTMPMSLTVSGWQKFEELERDWQNSNTAFVAMWFDKSTKAYRKAVEEAIGAAGYTPVIIDSYEHNNFIMDEVINKINEARFVIADFTCVPEQQEKNGKIPGGVRGGVYFEAGYARGLGKEVIATCCDSDDAKKRRHFDIDQLNTLFWHVKGGKLYDGNNKDFTNRLAERIKATVGKGKLH